MRASIVGLAFSTAARDADYLPTGHRALGETASLPVEAALEVLRPLLEDEAGKEDWVEEGSIESFPARTIANRSMPRPSPPVGGIP